ncbi:MAG TPA: LamG-like jellyroll fold domain-containing protein [Thermoanaerobaculia bacterium]|nr:LamG-like jellyroll fold domain-containing protein [Thermoanaerobaculia bacterium]
MQKIAAIVVCLIVASANAMQTDVSPRPDENLKDYRARMEAHFAPIIAQRGLRALVEEEGSAYNDYVRFLRFWEPRLHPHGDFKEYFRQEAMQFKLEPVARRRVVRHAERDFRPVAGLAIVPNTAKWEELGPRSKPVSNVGVEGTGPTEFIVFGPQPSRMLCGSNAGGLFYSTNGGLSWSSTGTDTEIGRSGVGTAVFHPTDYQTWFAGSGGNSGSGDPGWLGLTGGIFRTTNQGATWTQIATQGQLGGIWTQIFKLSINPTNANQLWAATSNGLFTTTGALTTNPQWTSVSPLGGEYVFDFEIHPGNANTLYATAGTWINGTPANWRYMVSTNGGVTWQNVPGQPSSVATARALTIEVSPADADNLYCITIDPNGRTELHIYDGASGTWTLVYASAFINMGSGHAFGVDPFNPNEIFLSDGTEGRRYTVGSNPTYVDFLSSYYVANSYHPDIEDLVPHPVNANEVWMCHHGGVAVSLDNGVTWLDRSTGIGTAQAVRMSTAAGNPSYVALGLYHDGSVITTSAWHNSWGPPWKAFQSSFCDGLRPLVSRTGQFMWHSCQFGNWYRSSDYGQTFQSNSPPYSPSWISEAVLNRIDSLTQFRVSLDPNGHHTIMRTSDAGNTWQQIVDFESLFPAASYEYILWKAYTSETAGDDVIVHLLERPTGSSVWWRNHLFRTKVGDAPLFVVTNSWHELPIPVDQWMSDVDFDPINPDIVYLTNGTSTPYVNNATGLGMVYRVDYANPSLMTQYTCNPAVCRDVTQNLPNASTGGDSLAIDIYDSGSLYLATDYGVYYSNAATRAVGNGWTKLGRDLPNANASGLEINQVNKRVRVATFGRGAWEHDLVATIAGTKFEDLNGNGAWDFSEPTAAGVMIEVMNVATGLSATAITNASGQYSFHALAAGTYTVSEPQQSGWTQTFPAGGSYAVQLVAGETRSGVHFGNRAIPFNCVSAPPQMTAWWTLDTLALATVNDRAGTNNVGTLVGGPVIVPGKVQGALHFNGTSQAVQVASHPELQLGTGDFTIDAWVRTTATGVQPIVDKRSFAATGYALFLFSGRLAVNLGDRPGSGVCSNNNATSACTNFFAPAGSVNVADGQWHHVAVTIDRDAHDGGRFYVDGVITGQFDPTIRDQSLDTTDHLWLGLRVATTAASSPAYFDGVLDEVEIFPRALSTSEIQNIARANMFGKCKCSGPTCNQV